MEFWDMTYGEIIDIINAYNKKQTAEYKMKALYDYTLVALIGRQLSATFNKNEVHMPSLEEAYEFIFTEEKAAQEEARAEMEAEILKERMRGFAINHNRKWGETHDSRRVKSSDNS